MLFCLLGLVVPVTATQLRCSSEKAVTGQTEIDVYSCLVIKLIYKIGSELTVFEFQL